MDHRETIGEGRFLGLYAENGWEFAARTHASGVVGILPVTDDRHVILIEQFRPPVGRPVIELPAGVVGDSADHPDESPEHAAHRELLEETGYEAASLQVLGLTPSSPGLTNELFHLFLATGLTRVHDGGGVDNEDITVHRVPRATLSSWLAEKEAGGALIDCRIAACLWLAEERGLI